MRRPAGRRLAAVATAVILTATGCSSSTTQSEPESPATQGSTGSPIPGASPSATVAPVPGTSGSASTVVVDWSGGRDAPGMDVGIPSPSGWYDAALGPVPAERVLYLTFDDGPAQPYTDELLDLLAANQARATFFMVGRVAAGDPDTVRRVAEAGNAIGNHSWSHADLLTLSRREVRRELADTQEALLGLGGPCMRPPYGLIDEQVADVAAHLGLTPVMWTGHAGDWNQRPAAEMVRRLKDATEPGAVLLLHDGGGPRGRTVEAVATLLPWWAEQGYRLEPLPPCTP